MTEMYDKTMPYRTFLLCDDDSPDFFVGRITRNENQVKPELWNLEPGDFLAGAKENLSFTREA